MDAAAEAEPRLPQPWPIRVSHWLNLPLLVIMSGSGMQILDAFPSLGPRGAPYRWYPFQDHPPATWLRIGGWLAGGRDWHFAFAWLFVANGLFYLAYFVNSGEWRRRLFLPRRDTRNAVSTLAYYLRLRKTPPEQGFYNGLQRLSYTGVLVLGILSVVTGLALYKPVQLRAFGVVFGGYDGARAAHLIVLALFALFTIGHLLMVSLHPRSLAEMITGGKPHG